MRETEKILTDFTLAVETTGGIEMIDGVPHPIGEPEWTDLGYIYLDACQALRRHPKVTGHKRGRKRRKR